MAAPAKPAAKGAAPKKAKSYSIRNVFEAKGGKLTTKNKTCPKCGPGMYLANHKDRVSCGFCKYTEFTGKK